MFMDKQFKKDVTSDILYLFTITSHSEWESLFIYSKEDEEGNEFAECL
jgi:hypothetical protein